MEKGVTSQEEQAPMEVADFGTDPFLIHLYDIVDDPNTDNIISWGSAGKSFVVWDVDAFLSEIAPDDGSFFEDLISYFPLPDVNANGVEFANEGFQRGQRQLLKTIKLSWCSPLSPSSSQQGQASSSSQEEEQGPMEGVADFGANPFLIKLYDAVDDPNTDTIISWGSAGKSFVIWDTDAFIAEIGPRYFKSRSSFCRQLHSYFRPVNGVRPYGTEFANEGFQRGQRQLLKTIKRRRSPSSPSSSKQGQASAAACPEVGLDGEVHRLQRDKGTLLAEVAKQQDPIPSCSPHAERSDLDMPRSLANGSLVLAHMENLESRGSSPSLGSGQDPQMRRSMTMPETHGLSGGRHHHPERTREYATTTGIEGDRATTITAAFGIGIGGARATTTAVSDSGIGGARATTTGTGIGGARATTTASGTGIGGVRAVRETEAQRRLGFSSATSDLEAGGGAPGDDPAPQPPEEEARMLKTSLIQIYAALLASSFMSYSLLKDAPKHVKIITFGGQVIIIAILFVAILSRSLTRRRFAFWLVFFSAVALLTFSVASQL